MCGRLTLTTPARVVAEHFGLSSVPSLAPRYNIAPTQPVAIVRERRSIGERTLEMRHWGLIPAWAKDPAMGGRLINARAETVASRPAYRDAFRRRRCLVPADGFYEWQARGRASKQPYYVHPSREPLFAIAGLYERWTDPTGRYIDSCTLVTAPANARLRRIHGRMPAILPREAWPTWLDPTLDDPAILLPLLGPSSADALDLHPVASWVNDIRHDDPRCSRAVPERFPELFPESGPR